MVAGSAGAGSGISSVYGGDSVTQRGDEAKRGVVQRVAALSDSEEEYSDEELEVRDLASTCTP